MLHVDTLASDSFFLGGGEMRYRTVLSALRSHLAVGHAVGIGVFLFRQSGKIIEEWRRYRLHEFWNEKMSAACSFLLCVSASWDGVHVR